MSKTISRNPITWLFGAAALAAAIYWQGVSGPFLMDDGPQLATLKNWTQGTASIRDVLFNNTGWLKHRSLAFASLALNAAIGGFSAYSFKAGNLLLHLICAGIAFFILRKLLRRDSQLASNADWVACLITIVWLIHPLNVSTVLYPIQRMAQIAMLACLAGLLFYAIVRERMIEGRTGAPRGMLLLWIGIPTLTFIGIQGKQNAIVLPALCLVLELTWFQRYRDWPRSMRAFYISAVALPTLAAIALPFFIQDHLASAFAHYDFSAGEKLLSAPRVLWDYVRMLLLPHSPSMGIFADGFAVSRSLTDPLSTLPAILGLAGITASGWALRRLAPSFMAGWMLFLIGHAVEASYVPIELYYEHRNYAVGIWLFLCVASLAVLGFQRLDALNIYTQRIKIVLVAGLLSVLIVQTFGRVLVWQDAYTISAAAARANPSSLRATLAFSSASANIGRFDDAFETMERFGASEDPVKIVQAQLGKISLQCRAFQNSDPEDFNRAISAITDQIDLGTFYVLHMINQQRRKYGCGPLTAEILAHGVRSVAERATSQPDTTEFKTSLRYLASVFYSDAGLPDEAADQAIMAWQPGADAEVGRQLVDSLVGAGRLDEAQIYLLQVAEKTRIDLQAIERPGRDVWGLWELQRTLSVAAPAKKLNPTTEQ